MQRAISNPGISNFGTNVPGLVAPTSFTWYGKPYCYRVLGFGTLFVLFLPVFHRILDLKTELDFYPALFFMWRHDLVTAPREIYKLDWLISLCGLPVTRL